MVNCSIRTLCTKHTYSSSKHPVSLNDDALYIHIFFFSLDGLVVLKSGAFSFIVFWEKGLRSLTEA